MSTRQNYNFSWLVMAGAVAITIILLQLILNKPTIVASLSQVGAQHEAPVTGKVAKVSNLPTSSDPTSSLAQSSQVATAWFDLYLDLVKTTEGFTPPVAARSFGYAGVALYEAVVPGAPGYQSLVGQLNGLGDLPKPTSDRTYDWSAVANSTLASIARTLFAKTSAENLAAIAALEEQWNQVALNSANADTIARSALYGQSVAGAIFEWSKSDGGHAGYLRNFTDNYEVAIGAGLWQPTPPKFQPTPLQPSWGENRPFVLNAADACPAVRPFDYSEVPTSRFYQESQEVYTIGENLSEEQRAIALFWSDDPGQTATPPGHMISIATQVLKQEKASLMLAAEAYAKVGIAVTDAFIGCWHAKYEYNVLRPVSYIRQLIDPEWMPLLNTPAFPEYPSGHSVQSGAAATVLADLFGDDYSLVDRTHEARGLTPRWFTSFSAMAEEAAISRVYGGIHYRRAINVGLTQGQCIGETVNALTIRP